MKPKQIVLGGILVVGIGISAWLWSTTDVGEAEGDQRVMDMTLNFTCPQCKQQFTKTVEEARDERRANDGNVVCPYCQATGAVKTVAISGPTLDEEGDPVEEVDDEALKMKKTTGMRKR